MNKDKEKSDLPQGVLQTRPGPVGAGLPAIPEPSEWPSSYGIDEAVAIAVVPERAMIFWELASVIESGIPDGTGFHLVRLKLHGEIPKRENWWHVEPVGRFQDSGLEPGSEYIYMIARVADGEEIPVLVTNPIRMPVRIAPEHPPADLPSSIDLAKLSLKAAGKEEDQ